MFSNYFSSNIMVFFQVTTKQIKNKNLGHLISWNHRVKRYGRFDAIKFLYLDDQYFHFQMCQPKTQDYYYCFADRPTRYNSLDCPYHKNLRCLRLSITLEDAYTNLLNGFGFIGFVLVKVLNVNRIGCMIFCYISKIFRNSLKEVLCKKGFLKNFVKFIGKRLCFPVNFAKYLKTPFLYNTSDGCFWTPYRFYTLNFFLHTARVLNSLPGGYFPLT